jgi:hypothetical protein
MFDGTAQRPLLSFSNIVSINHRIAKLSGGNNNHTK